MDQVISVVTSFSLFASLIFAYITIGNTFRPILKLEFKIENENGRKKDLLRISVLVKNEGNRNAVLMKYAHKKLPSQPAPPNKNLDYEKAEEPFAIFPGETIKLAEIFISRDKEERLLTEYAFYLKYKRGDLKVWHWIYRFMPTYKLKKFWFPAATTSNTVEIEKLNNGYVRMKERKRFFIV